MPSLGLSQQYTVHLTPACHLLSLHFMVRRMPPSIDIALPPSNESASLASSVVVIVFILVLLWQLRQCHALLLERVEQGRVLFLEQS